MSNVLYARSHVTAGEGIGVVCAVGAYTQQGQYMASKFSISSADGLKNLSLTIMLKHYSEKLTKISYYTAFCLGFVVYFRTIL